MKKIVFKKESYNIIGACMEVHNAFGAGFLEAVNICEYSCNSWTERVVILDEKNSQLKIYNIRGRLVRKYSVETEQTSLI